ncbi:hypothetical protein EPI10_021237 [Gossypium australe]|uniref:Uncharacterized protein n=1 Tax=Gossypium australe TaxID=47621 RepID=A0A5B6WIC3_9ROSI|nr:hypothetical protein EPI10_021237 [Gossypium australe]
MEEFRAQAYENANLCKEQTKRWHDKKILPLQLEPRQQVFLFNSRMKFPFEIVHVYLHRVVEVKDGNTDLISKSMANILAQAL